MVSVPTPAQGDTAWNAGCLGRAQVFHSAMSGPWFESRHLDQLAALRNRNILLSISFGFNLFFCRLKRARLNSQTLTKDSRESF